MWFFTGIGMGVTAAVVFMSLLWIMEGVWYATVCTVLHLLGGFEPGTPVWLKLVTTVKAFWYELWNRFTRGATVTSVEIGDWLFVPPWWPQRIKR